MKQLRRSTAIVGVLVSALTVSACGTPKAGLTGGDDPANVTFFASTPATHNVDGAVQVCNDALRADGITIERKPLSTEQPQEELTRKLSAKDTTVDIMAVPIGWSPEFAAAGWSEELRGDHETMATTGVPTTPVAAATYKKKLYAAPWTSDAQVLWYRTDLVPSPPQTWDDMMRTSAELAQQRRPHLVEIPSLWNDELAPFFVSLTQSFGSGVIDKPAKHAVTGDESQAAATLIRSFITSAAFDIEAQQSASLDPNAFRARFDAGQAAFLIESADIYDLPPKNVAMTRLPRLSPDEESRPLISGTNLVVSAYSKNQKQAMKAVECLRGADGQLALRKWPLQPERQPLLDNAVVRESLNHGTAPLETPVGEAVYAAIQQALLPVESIDPATVNQELATAINTALDLRADR
jgi:multiple sugar transport system substrate-binding protein